MMAKEAKEAKEKKTNGGTGTGTGASGAKPLPRSKRTAWESRIKRADEGPTPWPDDMEFPTIYVPKPPARPLPCPKCRNVFLPNGGQCTVLRANSPKDRKAWLRCRYCDHYWMTSVADS